MQNIYNDLLELSDLDFQRKLWLNENNDTGLISSYIELMNRLFDDNSFDDFIDNGVPKITIDPNVVSELHKLRNSLNEYEEKGTDREIISDPRWVKISEQAKLIIKMWNNYLNGHSGRSRDEN